jgi:hypothetical protein
MVPVLVGVGEEEAVAFRWEGLGAEVVRGEFEVEGQAESVRVGEGVTESPGMVGTPVMEGGTVREAIPTPRLGVVPRVPLGE